MANKILFTVAMLAEMTLASINANEDQNPDEIIDAIAEQYHVEAEPALKKTLGVKYSELAKARNLEVGRKFFYETIQTAEKNGNTKTPEKRAKATTAGAKTEGDKDSAQTDASKQADAGNTEGGDVNKDDKKEGGEGAATKPVVNRIKITDEIIEKVIIGIAAGKKPKEIAGGDIGQKEGEAKTPLGITADNVYDILHCRGRFDKFKVQVDAAKEAASKLPKTEAEKSANKDKPATQPATTPNAGGEESKTSPLDAPVENKAIEVAKEGLAETTQTDEIGGSVNVSAGAPDVSETGF